jgi:hypothetical protein
MKVVIIDSFYAFASHAFLLSSFFTLDFNNIMHNEYANAKFLQCFIHA